MENTLKKLTKEEALRLVREGREMKVGTEVYYTGDMANQDGFGEVTAVNPATKWGPVFYTVKLQAQHYNGCEGGPECEKHCQQERTFQVEQSNFEGPGRRFMTKAEYDADRAERIAQMKARMGAK